MLDMTGAGHYNLYRTESVQRDYTRAQQAENSKDLLQIKVSPPVIRSCLFILTEYRTKLSPSDNLHRHILALIEHTRRFNSAYNKPLAYPIYKNQCKIILDLKIKPEGWEKVSEVFRHMFNVFDRLWTGIVWLGTGTLLGKKTMAETYNPLAYAVTLGHRNHFFTEPVKNIRTKIELFDNAVTQLELYSRGLSSDHGSIVP